MSRELPRGWVRTTLGEVCLPVATIQPEDTPDTEFTYLDIGGIDNETNHIAETKTILGRNAPSRARLFVRKGDILFSTVRTYLRKIALVEQDYPNPVASTGFTVIRAAEGVSSQFLFFQALSDDFLRPLHLLQSGGSYPAVRDRDVFAQPIVLPPAGEQERIASKLNAAMSALQRAETVAHRAQERLNNYRAAVLNAAVTGELTREWRELEANSSGTNALTGDALLHRLLVARRLHWEEAELKRLHPAGKQLKDNKWKSRYSEPIQPTPEGLPELPENWTWASVDQLAAHEERSITDGPFGANLKSSHYTDSGPRVVRLQNIGDGVFIDERAHISQEHYDSLRDYAVYAGDLVIRTFGTPSLRACKIPNSLGPAIVKADCIRFKVASEYVSSDFVMWALNSPLVRTRAETMTHGIGRPRLNLREIKSIPIPLPPLVEQAAIVYEVERRLTSSNQLSTTLKRQFERMRETQQSLLREGFSGRLVPQDPNDEPASVLLERIRAAREVEAQKPKVKHMRKAKSSPKKEHRPLLDVLREHKKPITPEQLFREAGFEPSQVDHFYLELASLRDKLIERKAKAPEIMAWPDRADVLLELKEG